MIDRKQSFLERLTGVHKMDEDEFSGKVPVKQEASRGAPIKSWDSAVSSEVPHLKHSDDTLDEEPLPEPEGYNEEEEEAGLAIDMYESDNELIIQSMVAGITPDNLHISITRDSVTLSGRRVEPKGITDDHYVVRELYWGTFSRVIDLPYEINTDGAEAVEKYGLLIIRLPKLDTERTQELRVKSI